MEGNFWYDRYGNRTAHDKFYGTTQAAESNITDPTIDQNTNRFATGQGYTFDKNGNLISDAENRGFTFNGDNKQTKVIQNGQTVGEYFFDGEGRRVKKKVYNAGVLQDETVFVYSNGKLIAEYSTAPPAQNPTTSYTVTDQLGSPRVITNSQGEVVSRRDFMPFGEQITPDGTYRTANLYNFGDNIRQKFTGYQKDEETQLDFAEARMYENRHARFTAVDPLLASGKSANPQTFNRYVYVLNRPLTYSDPSGLQAATNPDSTDEGVVVRIYTWITKAGEYITRTFSWGGQSVTVRERAPIPESFVPTDIFSDPESVEAIRARRSNAILDSFSPTYTGKAVYPWATPEQANQAADTLGKLDLTGTFDLAWTSYRHSIGQASDTDLAISYGMFGTNLFGAGGSRAKLAKNMVEAGAKRLAGFEAHHIVAFADNGAAEARAILERAGIGINDAVNGVFLKGPTVAREIEDGIAHRAIHTRAYYNEITKRLQNSQNVRETLTQIGREIAAGTFPF